MATSSVKLTQHAQATEAASVGDRHVLIWWPPQLVEDRDGFWELLPQAVWDDLPRLRQPRRAPVGIGAPANASAHDLTEAAADRLGYPVRLTAGEHGVQPRRMRRTITCPLYWVSPDRPGSHA